jgi:hypothetical protein
VCEYDPPGNYIGQFGYVSYRHSIQGVNLHGFFYPVKMFKPKTNVSAFYLALYLSIVQVNGFLLTHILPYFDGRR